MYIFDIISVFVSEKGGTCTYFMGFIDLLIKILTAGAVSAVSVAVYMRIPARWLCEFDELPGEVHMPGMRGAWKGAERFSIFALIFVGALFCFFKDISALKCAAVICLFAAALCDTEYMIIPDQLLAAALAAAFLMAAAAGFAEQSGSLQLWLGLPEGGGSAPLTRVSGLLHDVAAYAAGGVMDAAAGAACSGGLLALSALFAAAFYGTGSIGMGDIKMMAACGALAGAPSRAALMFTTAVLSSAAFISAGILSKKIYSNNFIPMAPFITMAAIIFI